VCHRLPDQAHPVNESTDLLISTIGIGGVMVLTIQVVVMSWIRPFFSDSRYFDLCNVPVALGILIFLPVLDLMDWRLYGGVALALAVTASITVKKVADAKGKD
jgi:hypothetical protein